MRRFISAALLALCIVSYASADYLLVVVNLNAKEPTKEDSGQGGLGPPLGGSGGSPMMPPPMSGSGSTPKAPAQQGEPDDADDAPDLIVGVVEVKSLSSKHAEAFNKGLPIKFDYVVGGATKGKIELYHKTYLYESALIQLATPKNRLDKREKDVMGGDQKPITSDAVKRVALFALEMGLVDDCARVMDKLAESDKTSPAVKAYLAVKAGLDKGPNKFDPDKDLAATYQRKLLDGYKVHYTDKHHFALIHPSTITAKEAEPRLDQLERTFRAYYYWWACRGVALPVSQDRLVAVLTEKAEDFGTLQKTLTSGPVVADSFFARREVLSVFSNRRGDLHYDKMGLASKRYWDLGFDRHQLVGHDQTKGIPKAIDGTPVNRLPAAAQLWVKGAHLPRLHAVLMKAMESEWEQTSMTHEASRQMLFATKQLPRNVAVPEWIQFGIGSFFEVPLQAPWPSIGAASPYWMPRFKEAYKGQKYGKVSDSELLRKVVTDGLFREKATGDKESDRAKSHEVNQRKARSAAWALTYYLARAEDTFPKLQRYFKEVSKLPRDVELDDKALWALFCRAFDLSDEAKVKTLANKWIRFITVEEKLDAEAIHVKIREFHNKMNTPPAPKQGNTGVGGGGLGPVPPMK